MSPDPHIATPPAMMAAEPPQLNPPSRESARLLTRGESGTRTPSAGTPTPRIAPDTGRPGNMAAIQNLPGRARAPAHADRVYERA